MADEAPDANPFFQEVPSADWQLHYDPIQMIAHHTGIMLFILGSLIAAGAELFFAHFAFRYHPRRLTAPAGFIKIIMRPPPSRNQLQSGQEEVQGVPLLFSLTNLYLVGFLHNNIWYVFDDADLQGTGLGKKKRHQHWDFLGFKGRYSENRFNTVDVGMNGLFSTCKVLSEYLEYKQQHQQGKIKDALFRVMVVISEAMRFPQWLSQLHNIFSMFGSSAVDATYDFSDLQFKKWKKISKHVRDGPDSFEPCFGFEWYSDLIASVTVLLR